MFLFIKKSSACLVVSLISLHALADNAIRIGTTPAGAPFTFIDTATGKSEGMMIDIIDAIAKDNNIKIELQPMQFATLVPALVSNKIDVVSAAITATAVRKKVVNFSDPVYTYGEGLIVRASDPKPYQSIQDMKGERVGAVVGTSYLDAMQKSGVFKDVVAYDTTADMMSDIEAGRIDAGFGDGPVLAYRFSHATYSKLRLVQTYKPMVYGLGISIAVRKDQPDLLSKINASIVKMKADGTLAGILKKWNL